MSSFSPQDVTYEIPNIVPAPIAKAAALLDSTSADAQHDIVQRLRIFRHQVEKQTRLVASKGALDIYAFLAKTRLPPSITPTAALSLLNLGHNRIGRTDPLTRKMRHFAMHKILMSDPEHFVADQSEHSVSHTFAVRPAHEVADFELVQTWYREKSPQMMGFVGRAAAARKWGIEHPPTANSKMVDVGLLRIWSGKNWSNWTPEDLTIIRFFRNALDNRRKIQTHPHQAIASSIIKLVEDRNQTSLDSAPLPPISTRSGFEFRSDYQSFLAAIGVVPAWENWVVHDRHQDFEAWDKMDKSVTGSAPSKPSLSSLDPHDSVRKDFGEMAVYVVDDLGAKELDDGISIEVGPPSNGAPSWWIHVHIADPTTIIRPGEELALLALRRGRTEYLPERTWAMLPSYVLDHGHLSLGSQEGQEQKVLTFSTRINEEGEVLEIDVHAGIVRRTRRLTYADLDIILNSAKRQPSTTLFSEPTLPPDFVLDMTPRNLDTHLLDTEPSITSDLKRLQRLSKAILRQRAKNALYWNLGTPSVVVLPTLPYEYSIPAAPKFYVDAPLVALTLPPAFGTPVMTPSQNLVSECMILANRTAARFCVERGLAAPFRVQAAIFPSEVLAARDPATGEVAWDFMAKQDVTMDPASFSVHSKPHRPMGIVDEYGYVQVTSPLRRYSDILGHWQIKSALLGSGGPAFTHDALAEQLNLLELFTKPRKHIARSSVTFWALYVIQKKWDLVRFNPAADPIAAKTLANLTCVATKAPTFVPSWTAWFQPVMIPELGVAARLITSDESQGVTVGERANVRLVSVELSERSSVTVELKP